MISKIVWDSSFETGIAEIDSQHQQLVQLINELVDSVGHVSKEGLAHCVFRLKEYAKFHFQAEEKIMAAAAYADLEEHRGEHAAFLDQILLFDLDVILATEGLAWDMLHFLREWLTSHILVSDKKFSTS